MNLIDAIKTGRPIRRSCGIGVEGRPTFHGWICSKHMLVALGQGDMRPFSEKDFLADDWEVQETTVTIELKAFDEAFMGAVNYFDLIPPSFKTGRWRNEPTWYEVANEMARRLGLKL